LQSAILFIQLMFVLAALIITVMAFSNTFAHAAEPEPKLKEHIEISTKVNDFVKTIEGVSDSVTAVVFDQCFVAIKCENVVEQSKIKEIKKEIKKSITENFRNIRVVFVSSDLNTFVKMDKLTKRIKSGEEPETMKAEIMELKKLFNVRKIKIKGTRILPDVSE